MAGAGRKLGILKISILVFDRNLVRIFLNILSLKRAILLAILWVKNLIKALY